jgi:hypothetical protein
MAYFELERIYLEDLKSQKPPMTPLEIRRNARNVKQTPIERTNNDTHIDIPIDTITMDTTPIDTIPIDTSNEFEWKKVDRQQMKKSRKIEAMIKRFEDTEELLETIIENSDMPWE